MRGLAEATQADGQEHRVSLPALVLDVWQHAPQQAQSGFVLPDGCCDLIWHRTADGQSSWFLTRLYDTASPLEVAAGEHYCGYRLRPGAVVNETALLAALQHRRDPDSVDALALLSDCASLDPGLAEAMACLADASRITTVTRQLGLTERSLERLVMRQTGRTPGYWKQLARIRRAARALAGSAALADIAFAHCYADQAQMSRDFQRWFGVTPSSFRRDPALLALVAAPGFD